MKPPVYYGGLNDSLCALLYYSIRWIVNFGLRQEPVWSSVVGVVLLHLPLTPSSIVGALCCP